MLSLLHKLLAVASSEIRTLCDLVPKELSYALSGVFLEN
jgi:hypothetical protein